MKLEKINDNQIRCTLSKMDLAQRQLKLSELAYGSEKAKELFHDMMQQASIELGFEAENIPLMIEAIPISSDCLILVVTKVEDPDELDTRFSRFSHLNSDSLPDDLMDSFQGNSDFEEIDFLDDDMDEDSEEELSFSSDSDPDSDSDSDSFHEEETDSQDRRSSIDEALNLIAPFTQAIAQAKKEVLKKQRSTASAPATQQQYYYFREFAHLARLGSFLAPFYQGKSTLYKDPVSSLYYLILSKEEGKTEYFQRACSLASDFGVRISASYAVPSYFKEHYQLIAKDNAIQILNELS